MKKIVFSLFVFGAGLAFSNAGSNVCSVTVYGELIETCPGKLITFNPHIEFTHQIKNPETCTDIAKTYLDKDSVSKKIKCGGTKSATWIYKIEPKSAVAKFNGKTVFKN